MINQDISSRWMSDEFHSPLLQGKHLIISGNVHDPVLLNGNYMSLSEFLNHYFQETGFPIIARYDIVDGFRLIDPDRMMPLLSQACASSGGMIPGSNSFPEQSGTRQSLRASTISGAGITSPATSEPSRLSEQLVQPAPTSRRPVLQTPEQVFPVVRQLMRQTDIPTAIIIEFSDQLFTDPKHQDESERRMLTLVKKTTQETAHIRRGPLEGRKNCLVMIAESLVSVPPWLYEHNDAIRLTHLPKPDAVERGRFIRRFYVNFHEGNTLRDDECKKVIEQFIDNTEGLSLRDLDTMYRMSRVEKLSIREPKKMIQQFKIGRQDNPWEKLDPAKIRDARSRLEQRVVGQPNAVDAVVRMLNCALGGITCMAVSGKGAQPKVLLCCGPTGVGKTELAKALAELLYGDESACFRIDMSEYKQEHADQRLIGSPPGFAGHEEGGQLTNRCLERPFSLFLFDEFEKAHPRILDLFLQVLEDGRLTDGRGRTAFFSDACLMFTSNIGGSTLDKTLYGEHRQLPDYETIRNHYLKAVQRRFKRKIARPELLNRFGGNIVVFDIIRPEHMPAICRKFLALCAISAKQTRGILLEWDESIVQLICRLMRQPGYFEMGGRRIKTLIEELVLPALNQWVLVQCPKAGQTVRVSSGGDGRVLINVEVAFS